VTYNAVTDSTIRALATIVGAKNVIVDSAKVETYGHDETNVDQYGHSPEVVVLPATPEEVASIVRFANQEMIPVTPRGAGSGLSGGAIPVFGGILLSVERMSSIVDLDVDNMTVTVEAGIVTNELAEYVRDYGLFFAGYPMSLETCFISGNIAENAGGGKAVKYGVTGRYVLGLEFVTPTGNIVQLGGKLSKNVSGYNLTQLIVGSEGTLGIVTKTTIKLIGAPKNASDLLVLFPTPKDAIDLVPDILRRGIVPTSLEFMDRLSFETSCTYLNETLPYGDAGAMMLIEIDGNDTAQIEKEIDTIGDICDEHGAIEIYVAEDRNTIERVWNVRRNIAEAFKVYSPIQSLEDIVIPPAEIPKIIPELQRMSDTYNVSIPCYGHAGDGNLHATLVKDPAMDMDEWHAVEERCLRDLYAVTTRLGGKISGEHGIGLKRKRFLEEIIDPGELELMRAIKRGWDPNYIMNPGKIFDLPD
jgi:glycolate oxidase